MTGKRKLAYVALLSSIGIVLLIWRYGIAAKTVQITESPQGRYKVEVAQRKFFIEDAVYLNAYRHKDRFVSRKLLYTADFLDEDFQDLYPTCSWISENTLQIGQRSVSEHLVEVSVSNKSETYLSYLLLETLDNKVIVFDVQPNSLDRLSFAFSERLSCQGQTVGGDRFGGAVELVNTHVKPRRVDIRIAKGTITIDCPDQNLKATKCCAADRPDFDHEWLY